MIDGDSLEHCCMSKGVQELGEEDLHWSNVAVDAVWTRTARKYHSACEQPASPCCDEVRAGTHLVFVGHEYFGAGKGACCGRAGA